MHRYILQHTKACHYPTMSYSDTVMAILSHENGLDALRFTKMSSKKDNLKSWMDKSLKEKSKCLKESLMDKSSKEKHFTPMRMLIEHLPG